MPEIKIQLAPGFSMAAYQAALHQLSLYTHDLLTDQDFATPVVEVGMAAFYITSGASELFTETFTYNPDDGQWHSDAQ